MTLIEIEDGQVFFLDLAARCLGFPGFCLPWRERNLVTGCLVHRGPDRTGEASHQQNISFSPGPCMRGGRRDESDFSTVLASQSVVQVTVQNTFRSLRGIIPDKDVYLNEGIG